MTVETTTTFSDEYLEFYADRYVRAGIGIRGVTLLQYLVNPHRYDNFDPDLDPLPLLGSQSRIANRLLEPHSLGCVCNERGWIIQRVERSADDFLPRRSSAIVEPLERRPTIALRAIRRQVQS